MIDAQGVEDVRSAKLPTALVATDGCDPFWLAASVGVEVVAADGVLVVCAVELADNPLGPLVAGATPLAAPPPPLAAAAAATDNWCWTVVVVVSVPFFGLSGPALACGLPEGSTRTIIAILLPLSIDNEK